MMMPVAAALSRENGLDPRLMAIVVPRTIGIRTS
jgi:hypothetical protein